jgi:hypothetical protein
MFKKKVAWQTQKFSKRGFETHDIVFFFSFRTSYNLVFEKNSEEGKSQTKFSFYVIKERFHI